MRAYFDDLEPGQNWGTWEWTASPEICRGWSEAVGDRSSLHGPADEVNGPPHREPIMPPGLIILMYSYCMDALMPVRPPGGIYAEQKLRFGVPARIGDVLSTSLKIHDKYIKRDRKIVEMETVTRNATGEMVVEGRRTVVWGA